MHEFLSKLKKAMESVVVGDPLLEETDVSALISKRDVERIDMWVQEAIKEGATVLCGGKKRDARIFEPTVLTNVPIMYLCSAKKYSSTHDSKYI